ncbi:MAG: sigma-70 family RNA polymerase sigma factor [Planctomycetes bacterium]|nr:sigma-70 family RNA polymerase sigma factor [Planctomycetota bacterium]
MTVDRPAAETDELSDRELLRRFRAGHDETAFAAIIRRHGSMVLRVCQRVLDRREDAEDAFQATFLVLAKKAASVAWRDSIGTWLHAAAHRLAREVRRSGARRQVRETRRAVPAQGEGDALAEVTSRELLTILDEELAGLPEEYRGPLLCCMEGMSGDEAAGHLGCSPSTLKRRLRHARELLQARLAGRGIALSAAAVLALLAASAAAAGPAPALAEATVRAAVLFHTGAPLAPGLVSGNAVALTRHILPAVSMKVKTAAGLLALGGLVVCALVGRGPGDARNGQAAPPMTAPVAVRGEALGPPAPAVPVMRGVPVTVETTLRTRGEWIRQFAFDGNPNTFFASVDRPGAEDHFTLVFDRAVAVTAVEVRTGTPNGFEGLASGRLEVSEDGKTFEPLAGFDRGAARGDAGGRRLFAVRVRPGAQPHPLLVREIAIASDPPLAAFRHPVEFSVDVSRAPEMAKWAEHAARLCERAYPMVCDELAADGFRPPTRVPFLVRRDAGAIVAASRGRVIASAGYFEENPHDVGAVVHATSLVVQAYPERGAPDWLVHGVADYVRFFKFEPGAIGPPDPDTARHDGNSHETAAFLAYLVTTYDPDLVRRLNAALRAGRYDDDIWSSLTGKSLRELDDEWRRALRR